MRRVASQSIALPRSAQIAWSLTWALIALLHMPLLGKSLLAAAQGESIGTLIALTLTFAFFLLEVTLRPTLGLIRNPRAAFLLLLLIVAVHGGLLTPESGALLAPIVAGGLLATQLQLLGFGLAVLQPGLISVASRFARIEAHVRLLAVHLRTAAPRGPPALLA